jgi:chromosome segregation ATPase
LSLGSDNAVLKQQIAEMSQRVEQYHAMENALKTAEESLAAIQAELANTESEGLNVVHQWEQRTKELEAVIADLEQTLESQQQEASEVIGQWSAQCSELENKVCSLESSLGILSKENSLLEASAEAATRDRKVDRDYIERLQVEVQSHDDSIKELERQFTEERDSWIEERKSMKDELEKQLATAHERESEATNLSEQLAEAQGELETVKGLQGKPIVR